MKIEILHYRDSDGGCDHDVWVDGVRTDDGVVIETIDPGRGHILSEWNAGTQEILDGGGSPSFIAAVASARDEAKDSKYIEED